MRLLAVAVSILPAMISSREAWNSPDRETSFSLQLIPVNSIPAINKQNFDCCARESLRMEPVVVFEAILRKTIAPNSAARFI